MHTHDTNKTCIGFHFVFVLQAPYLSVSTCSHLPWLDSRFGNPQDASYVPSTFLGMTDRKTLSERIQNTIFNFLTSITYHYLYDKPVMDLVDKYVGPTPSIQVSVRVEKGKGENSNLLKILLL